MSTYGDPTTRGRCLELLDVFVLAGGLGTRIRRVLADTPKLLAPIGGRTYLDHLLDWLRGFGARRVILGLGHRADAIVEYLRQHPADDLDVSAVIEPRPLGTAGAIRFARRELRTDPVLVVNGDSLVDADLCALIAHHRALGARATLLGAEVEDAGRYGRVSIDRSGRIQEFVEKDPGRHDVAVVSAGVYLLTAGLLDEIAAGAASSLERDVFARLPAGSLAALSACVSFVDIGTPESLTAADRIVRAGSSMA